MPLLGELSEGLADRAGASSGVGATIGRVGLESSDSVLDRLDQLVPGCRCILVAGGAAGLDVCGVAVLLGTSAAIAGRSPVASRRRC